MVKSNRDSNSDGRVIGGGVTEEIWTNSNGDTLTMSLSSGSLFIVIRRKKENYGYLPATLYLILQLFTDGSICGQWG